VLQGWALLVDWKMISSSPFSCSEINLEIKPFDRRLQKQKLINKPSTVPP
jgi:hypothetical protein